MAELRQRKAAAATAGSESSSSSSAGSASSRAQLSPSSLRAGESQEMPPSWQKRLSLAAHVAWLRLSLVLAVSWEAWRQTFRDISRQKCTFCIGCSSIFLVVVTAALANTLIARAPLVFLREAETNAGQVDVRITPNDETAASVGSFLNYTQFAASIKQSPRALATSYSYSSGRTILNGRLYPQSVCANKYRSLDLASSPLLSDWPYTKYWFNDTLQRPGYDPRAVRNANALAPSQRDPFADSLVQNPLLSTAKPIDAGFCNSYLTCIAHCGSTTAFDYTSGSANSISVVLINTAREKRAGIGRGWTFQDQASEIPFGSAVLSSSLASSQQKAWKKASSFASQTMQDANAASVASEAASQAFGEGGRLNLWMPTSELLRALLPPLMTRAVEDGLAAMPPQQQQLQRQQASTALSAALAALVDQLKTYEATVLPLTVYGVATDKEMKSKFGSGNYGDQPLIMEADYLLPLVLRSLHPALRRALVNVLRLSGVAPLPATNTATQAMIASFSGTPPTSTAIEEAGYLARYALASGCPLSTSTGASVAAGSGELSCAIDHAASEIIANLPPNVRLGTTGYAASNYDRLRAAVADFASSMLYLSGFTETQADAPILTLLEPRRFITLYLGLVLDILLLTLFGLAIILIYSLLLANTESKTFEMAVRRMLGAGRPIIVFLQLTNAAAHALPAWILGLILAQIGAAVLFSAFGKAASLPIPTTLTPSSVVVASALGWAIPAIAVIGPVRSALKSNIHDALDPGRPSGAAGVKISLEQRSTGKMGTSAVIIGLTLTVFGFALYYLLPLALLSSNLSLLVNLFLVILLGMLAGLVLLSLNLELLLLRLVVWITIGWWEHNSVRKILWSNLSSAHRKRNRKTTIMYALSVALIVFITVAATGQISSASYGTRQKAGAPVAYSNQNSGNVQQATDEAVLAVYERLIRQASLTGSVNGVDSGTTIPGVAPNADSSTVVKGIANPLPVMTGQESGFLRHAWASAKIEGASAWIATAAAQRNDFTSASLPMTAADAASGATLAVPGSPLSYRVSSSPQSPWQLRLKPEHAWRTISSNMAPASSAFAPGTPASQQDPIWTTSDIQQRNTGRSSSWQAGVRAVSPTFFRGSTFADVLAVEKTGTLAEALAPQGSSSASCAGAPDRTNGDGEAAYSLSDALYTASGSGGALISNNMVFELQAEVDHKLAVQTTSKLAVNASAGGGGLFAAFAGGGGGPIYARTEHRTLALVSSSPFFFFSRAPTGADTVLVSMLSMPKLLTNHLQAVGGPSVLPQVESSTLASFSHLYGLGPDNHRTVAYCKDYLRSGLGMGNKTFVGKVKLPKRSDPTQEWALCLLKVMDNQALGIESIDRMNLLVASPVVAPVAGNGTNASNATNALTGLISEASLGTVKVPRNAGGMRSVLPLAVADIPVQASFIPSQESEDGVEDPSYLAGPLKNVKASTLAAQLQAAMNRALSNLASARSYLGGSSRPGNHLFKGKMTGSSYEVVDGTANSVDVSTTTTLLGLIFSVLAAIAMVLCFFSLSASMLSNIREQTIEIGMLRSLGMTRGRMMRVYAHEAVLLVLTASILGVIIGSVVAWTFSMQQSLFTGLPVPFVLPWGIIAVIVLFSFGLGTVAAGVPAYRALYGKPITNLLRGT